MNHLFNVDALSMLMMALIGFIGVVVMSFSARYLRGDSQQSYFFIRLLLVMLSVAVMVSANYVPLFLMAWALSNLLLSRLMLHKSAWPAARASAKLALRNYSLGWLSLLSATVWLALDSHSWYLNQFNYQQLSAQHQLMIGGLLLIAAMTQSAIWPFHRWLISSLNSPTPVSAFMHAGLVNGGGFLLARFAPLFSQQADLLQLVFLVGAITALVGTLWKLMQHDIKRMLACSTMAQMGFMIAECGLGLFAAAISHLIWHGMFKAFLFLNSGSSASEKKTQPVALGLPTLLLALAIGLVGVICFSWASARAWWPIDSSIVIVLLAGLACTQTAVTVLQHLQSQRLLLALMASVVVGSLYGLNLRLIEQLLAPMQLMQAQAMSALHWVIVSVMLVAWLAMLFKVKFSKRISTWRIKAYVAILNASQPDASTITAHRNHYRYE